MTHTHSIWLLWTRDRPVAANLPDDRHAQEADIHAPARIQTRNRSKRAAYTHAVDRAPTGDWPRTILRANNYHTNFPGIKPGLPQWDALCTQRPCGKTLPADFSVGFNSGRLLGTFVMNKV
jgi:hypothetical protein